MSVHGGVCPGGGGVCPGGRVSAQGRGCLPRGKGVCPREGVSAQGRGCLPGGVSLEGCLPIAWWDTYPHSPLRVNRMTDSVKTSFMSGKDLCSGCIIFQINNLQRILLLVFPKEKIERSRKPTAPLAKYVVRTGLLVPSHLIRPLDHLG